jgi:hypothetical protein
MVHIQHCLDVQFRLSLFLEAYKEKKRNAYFKMSFILVRYQEGPSRARH